MQKLQLKEEKKEKKWLGAVEQEQLSVGSARAPLSSPDYTHQL